MRRFRARQTLHKSLSLAQRHQIELQDIQLTVSRTSRMKVGRHCSGLKRSSHVSFGVLVLPVVSHGEDDLHVVVGCGVQDVVQSRKSSLVVLTCSSHAFNMVAMLLQTRKSSKFGLPSLYLDAILQPRTGKLLSVPSTNRWASFHSNPPSTQREDLPWLGFWP